MPDALRAQVIALIKERYSDFGPTLASEKLSALHGLSVSSETVRSWMIAEGLWADRKARQKPVYQPRYRRDCFGELVQIDGSMHWWFEERGPRCTLLVYIDDATSKLLELRFVQSESAFSYFEATKAYLQRYGKPIAFYSDKHSIFRVNDPNAVGGTGMTQFGRVLHELNIDIICANTPQAKGRVERANRTLQDRLVKELRLAGISTIAEANTMLPGFIEDYNARFAKPPANDKDLHRPLAPADDLGEAFAWRVERVVSASLTLQYDKTVFILEPNDITRSLARKKVMLHDYPDGRLVIRFEGHSLPFRTFDKVRQVDQGAIVGNKQLSHALMLIRNNQQVSPACRSEAAPRRSGQANSIFNAGGSISAKKRRRTGGPTRRAVHPTALPPSLSDRAAPAVLQTAYDEPKLTYDDLLCLEIGRRVCAEREAAMQAAKKLAKAEAQKPRPALLDDPDVPLVLKYFRLGNRYLVQRIAKTRGRKPGRPRMIVPNLEEGAPLHTDRVGAGVQLAAAYKGLH